MRILAIIFEGRNEDNILNLSEIIEILINIFEREIFWNLIDVELMIIIISLDGGDSIPNLKFLQRLENCP